MRTNRLSDKAQIDFSEGIASKTSALPSDIQTIFISKVASLSRLLTDHLNRVKNRRTGSRTQKAVEHSRYFPSLYYPINFSFSPFSRRALPYLGCSVHVETQRKTPSIREYLRWRFLNIELVLVSGDQAGSRGQMIKKSEGYLFSRREPFKDFLGVQTVVNELTLFLTLGQDLLDAGSRGVSEAIGDFAGAKLILQEVLDVGSQALFLLDLAVAQVRLQAGLPHSEQNLLFQLIQSYFDLVEVPTAHHTSETAFFHQFGCSVNSEEGSECFLGGLFVGHEDRPYLGEDVPVIVSGTEFRGDRIQHLFHGNDELFDHVVIFRPLL